MVALYVTSLERGSGKTTVCAGLGKRLLDDGKKIGFLKPIIARSKKATKEDTDSDATFIKRIFALEEPVGLLCPVFSDEGNISRKFKEAYANVSRGKDVVIVEGISDQSQASPDIAGLLDANVIIVGSYATELLKSIDSYKNFGANLLGVVLNKVPRNRIEHVYGEAATGLSRAGINLLGVLPEDRALFALTVGELAEQIQGEVLSSADKSAELVENFMVGAMVVDPGPDYFNRKTNKVVVLKSERPDMQLAAMETSVRCLILAGETSPKPVVLYRAEEKNVPIILAKDNITTVVANIEGALGKTRFNQENKLPKLTEIMEQYFDFQALYKGLGLAG
ncbi:DRTGG domain-containing protein [Chloroflexota bacterium]